MTVAGELVVVAILPSDFVALRDILDLSGRKKLC